MFVENIEEDEFVDVNEDFDNRGDIVQDIVIDTEVVYGVSEEVVEVNVDFGGRETAEDAFVDTNMEFGGREAPG